MALVFETILTEGISELSYLVGDDGPGVAAVVDPTTDVDRYSALARKKGVAITHILETHIHADLVSGSRELCARTGSAKIYVSHAGGAAYGFDHEELEMDSKFEFGNTLITAKHTPGHTPEHVSLLLAAKDHPDTPWGILTGDSLFVNSAGRPDLMGGGQTEELTEKLFHTLRDFYLTLPDSVIIYPAHGHGSPCGADIGERLTSTIGYERKHNPYLQFGDYEKFREFTGKSVPATPTYYPLMKKLNAKGPGVLGNLPGVPALPPKTFDQAVREKAGVLVDTRMMLAFGGGHIPGALNIGASPMLSIWAGWLLEPNENILLVLSEDKEAGKVLQLFWNTGYTRFAGYLAGGMKAWDNAALPLEEVGQMTVHELHDKASGTQILDVRSESEWAEGRVPGATHIFLPDLRKRCAELDRQKPVAVYCDSGYRASIGTSILKQEGFTRVCNVPGSWQAWKKAQLPVEAPNHHT
jgi:hydroxyacylglutathione hydrolase